MKEYVETRQTADDNIIRRMRIACWIPKAIDTHRIYNIYAFPLLQWLCERASVISYSALRGFLNSYVTWRLSSAFEG